MSEKALQSISRANARRFSKQIVQSKSEAKYVDFDPFLDSDRDVKISNRIVRIVTCRKIQRCAVGDHFIDIGKRARYEKAVVDGEFGSFYVCLPCLDEKMAV